ncbi:MAG: AAA family ATPase [Proteobacteria bacterium]|nr:AAA family ATPase [Pseudomonadota bacterium]MDA1298996.1 AAA family ATPase [Pseudomonadota bacterium]
MKDLNDLGLLLDSKVPILVIESYEEPRVLEMITRLAVNRASPLFTWSATEGLHRLGFGEDVGEGDHSTAPGTVLELIKQAKQPGIYVLCDFHPYLKDEPVNVRLLREIAMRHHTLGHTVILLSHALDLPSEVKRYSARFELSMPSDEQLMNLIREEASNWSRSQGGRPVRSDKATFNKLVQNLKGVPLQDATQLVRGAIYDDGAIDQSDLPELNKAKFALMDMEGVLSFEYDTARFSEVGGLNKLKDWLEARRNNVLSGDTDLDTPKGIMLLGIQGSGKSLAAKAVAGMWSLPLLRLDFGSLYNKFFGETERNLREALKLADMMSPCVLWLDEIEKGISIDQNDSGISQRILGTLLTWMSERKSMAFIVATSNDISKLPPELVRKGRLDEIFFVDLPDETVRMEIFAIHLRKRNVNPELFDLARLARASEGFSGAEIEQTIVNALYTVAASDEVMNNTTLERAIRSTNPLSVIMQEKVESLRVWARARCVFAD